MLTAFQIYYATTAVNIFTDWATALMFVIPPMAVVICYTNQPTAGPSLCYGTLGSTETQKSLWRPSWASESCMSKPTVTIVFYLLTNVAVHRCRLAFG